jgi:pimeloyl-ACP methyl ester carboxylesterase
MKLHFRKIGQGKPLIILHGLFGSADNWNTLAKEFSAQNQVFVVDQRNHGLSPHDAVFSYEAMSNDLLELLDDNKIEKANFIGHSMGGKVMMQFSSEYANRIEKMIIVDISPRYYKPHHQAVLQALHSINFDEITTRRQAEEILNPLLNDISTTQFLLKNIYWIDDIINDLEVKKLAWRFNLNAISSQIENVGIESPKPIALNAEKLQVLFIKGENSNYIMDDDKRLIRNYYPNAVIKTIANAGHWVQAEQPKEFFNTVIGFLK